MAQHRIQTVDGHFSAYLAMPKLTPAPVVIVLQEILGVNAGIRRVADELAEQGFIALCPDLFWRIEPGVELDDGVPEQWEKGISLYRAFDLDQGVADIASTIAAAKALPESTGEVGAVGFCLGGLLVFLSAARTDLDAGVAYYGGATQDHLNEASTIRAPLMLHLAGDDEYISSDAQRAIKAALASHDNVIIHEYPGRNHAFARYDGAHFDASDAAIANARTYTFLRDCLVDPSP